MSAPDWRDALPLPPSGGRLVEAWFTTYDQPDVRLLVEHLLPSLLGSKYAHSQEPSERTLFFGELVMALEALRGRITIISSPPSEVGQVSQYPWIGRYVNHYRVGAQARAVQHAKLWAFHWKVGDEEFIELHVSSTNLTTSAFKKQVQAGWFIILPLAEKWAEKTQQGWSELIPFLNSLGESAGNNAKRQIDRLVKLLGKVDCPDGVTFVASMPGSKNRATQQLKKLGASAIHILTPTVGDWRQDTLTAWSKDIGIPLAKVHLKWIDADHPWEGSGGWTLTDQANNVLQENGVQLNHLTSDARFSESHIDGDERWSHAKLYLLRIPYKKKRLLLLTSANWSPAAWGAGNLTPCNFELGVLLETDWKLLEDINGKLVAPFCTERKWTGNSKLQWVEATWNGQCISLHARSSDVNTPITIVVRSSNGSENEYTLVNGMVKVLWTVVAATPLAARFTQNTESREAEVIDIRSPAEFAKTPLPEVDLHQVKALREAFLLERYGGPAVDLEPNGQKNGNRTRTGKATFAADYSMQAWLDARAGFEVVDNWQKALTETVDFDDIYAKVRLDGEQLQALYTERGDVAASLVAEEFEWRLEANQ